MWERGASTVSEHPIAAPLFYSSLVHAPLGIQLGNDALRGIVPNTPCPIARIVLALTSSEGVTSVVASARRRSNSCPSTSIVIVVEVVKEAERAGKIPRTFIAGSECALGQDESGLVGRGRK